MENKLLMNLILLYHQIGLWQIDSKYIYSANLKILRLAVA